MNSITYIDHLPGRTLQIAGKEHLYFSGTSYLGIAKNDAFQCFLKEGIEKYGTNYSSSRISNLQLSVFEEVEHYLASYTGAEAALTMSSGFLAGQTAISLLQNKGRFIYAPRVHPALWLHASDHYNEAFDNWIVRVKKMTTESTDKHMIIVVNSLDPLQARLHNFNWIADLTQNKQFTILIDDSHGFGIIGKDGAGIFTELSKYSHINFIIISSFGKAFGIPGGIILSDKKTIELFTASPFFGGSSPTIPAYLYAFLQAKEIYNEERHKLFANINQFTEGIADLNLFQFFEKYPVFYTPENSLVNYLTSNLVTISSFPYPSPQDALITRIIINSLHTSEDIDYLIHLLKQFKSVHI